MHNPFYLYKGILYTKEELQVKKRDGLIWNICIGIVVLCIMLVLCIMAVEAWDKECTMRELGAQQHQQKGD